ncbi:MAG: hypothetical protein AB7L66_11285 [Gemmatimonadales bacterium]
MSRRLRRLLADVPTRFPCHYACFIHPRRRQGEQGFGVITLAGESLPLTVTMLEDLRRVPTLFEGRAPAVIGPAQHRDAVIPSDDGEWAVPLPVNRFTMRLLADDDEEGLLPKSNDEQHLVIPTSDGPQLTLLCSHRPDGWPA